ncbi:MAG: PASTA domain-containing protein [Bacteroidales bacterium]|jgi:beta-lactam-binding protein with PASTA domain|nr:PASTA domain-containing protein [Bacteroidales bacterium]
MAIRQFLKTKLFWTNFAVILVVFAAILFAVFKLLSVYTRHGEEFPLPDIEGLQLADLKTSKELSPFEIVIIDSIFTEGKPEGIILKQDPVAGTKVKKGRKIYVIVTSHTGEIIAMPNCTDQSVRMAVQQITAAGLRIGSLIFKSGDISNIVVGQKYEGRPVNPNAKIKRGSAIDLIVEISNDNTTTQIPNILGLTEQEAEQALWSASLNVGTKTYDGKKDTDHSRVVGFDPPYRSFTIGSAVSLMFANDTKSNYKSKLNEFKTQESDLDTINIPSEEDFTE